MRDYGILVVDNSREILDVIERMFSYFKIQVDSFTSAISALDSLHKKSYKTMIIAIDMQDMVGMELAHQAHNIDPELNVVLFLSDSAEQILKLTLDPTVSDISEIPMKSYSFGNMLLDIKYRETGKIFLLE
jgi:DNA-binding NtrC family response regulator